MHRWIAVGVVAGAVLGGGLWARAQVQPDKQVVSGNDFGFRIDHMDTDGRVSGQIVVRQNGKWVEVRLGAVGATRLK